MRSSSILLIAMLMACGCSQETINDQPAQKAATLLEKQSRSSLGVGVRALSFLFQARPGIFLLKDPLENDGSWQELVELEKAGFVILSTTQATEGEFVNITLTEKGELAISAFNGA